MSCSVVRRVALPGSFFAIDGLLETWITVLDEFGAYPAVIDREIERYLPFLASTKTLIAAVKAGMGREEAHACIKRHAVAAALSMRNEGGDNDFLKRLGGDPGFPLDVESIRKAIGEPIEFVGLAGKQIMDVACHVGDIIDRHPEGIHYKTETIL